MKPTELEELRKKAKDLSDNLYPTIGEFAVSFEAVCHALRMGVDIILTKCGLKSDKITDILVGDLTLFPLQNTYRALIAQTLHPNSDEDRIINNIFKRIGKLGEERNKILHAAWFIDFKNPADIKDGLLLGYKPGYSKRGAKDSPVKYPITNIKAVIKEARELADLIHELNMCIYAGRQIQVRFCLDASGCAVATGSIMDYFKEKSSQKKGRVNDVKKSKK